VQLYDLLADLAERKNLQAQYPKEVERLAALLKRCVQREKNDVSVDMWKTSASTKP
jgi:hypothetical protein